MTVLKKKCLLFAANSYFITYSDVTLYYFCYASSKIISLTYIPFSSNMFLDSLVIIIHIFQFVFISAIVMLALK